jgi:Chitobiase/beta-hexosaminidase C-terminal domain
MFITAPTVEIRPFMSRFPRFTSSLLGLSALTFLSACSGVSTLATSSAVPSVALRGGVHGGQQAVVGATIQLYTVGTASDGSAAATLGTSTTTAGDGSFTLTGHYNCSNAANGVNSLVYLLSTGGNPGSGPNANLIMMAALGQCSSLTSGTFIWIDEVTTVGSIAALYSPYMTSATNLGSGPVDAAAFATAFANVAQYTNTSNGTAPGPNLPGGFYASSTEINTLGNIIAACVNSTGGTAIGVGSSDGSACGDLFNLTRNGGSVAPTNTIAALINILKAPTQNASSLFSLPQPIAPFQPSLSVAPTTWALPILPIAATPILSVGPGTYSSAQFVTISDTSAGAVIHYTIDGSIPTSSSPTYSGTITVSSSETLNAIAVGGGFAASASASAAYNMTGSTSTYTLNGNVTLANNCGGGSVPPITVTLTHVGVTVQTTTSDPFGNYSFSGVPNDSYTVTPSITGPSSIFYPAVRTPTINGGGLTSLPFFANLGYTVSGTVSYGGSQTGRTYLALIPTNCGGNNGTVGTSISNTGAYTIRGVPPGSYTMQAWMDPLGQGVQNAIDPSGNTPLTLTAANVTNFAVAMNNPTFVTPTSNPTIQSIVPNPQGALILFQSSQNSSSVEDANQYVVEWSTSPTLGGGGGGAQFLSVAGSHTFTATGDKGLWVLTNAALSSGQTYYFQARSSNTLDTSSPHPAGWCNYTSSGCSGTTGFTPVTIATPPCSGTCTAVSGSVTIPAAININAGAPLYLGLLQFSGTSGGDPIGFYVTEIASPSNSANNFTVSVPSGSNYAVIGILDQNNNGGFGAGSITNVRDKVQANLTISGSTQTVAGVTLPTSNSTATVGTQFSSNSCLNCGSPSTSYQLSFTVNGSDKLPVAVTLNSGPNVPNNNGTVALDMSICTNCGNPQFGYSISLSGTPNVGDTYGFTVTYSDGSQDTGTTVTGAVTGWNGGSTVAGASDSPTALLPINNSSISTTPTFTWTDSSNSMGANFSYSFYLSNSICSGSCTIWQVPGSNSKTSGFSDSITSIPWITTGNDVTGASNNLPSVSALTLNSTYYWQVQVQDSNGNSVQTQVQYQP